MTLDVFFRHLGTKWRSAPRYPAPAHDTIIEPFAGAAGYSVRHHRRKVILVEKDPEVAAVWRYLIRVTPREILALPNLGDTESALDLKVSEEARHLIRRNINRASGPCNQFTAWRKGNEDVHWGPVFKARLASQVEKIRHWRVIEGDYTLAPDIVASWFIDPPYEAARLENLYRAKASALNFTRLADWCRSRRGQVIVCEGDGATWLPFRVLGQMGRAVRGKGYEATSTELIWTNDTTKKETVSTKALARRAVAAARTRR